MRRHGKWTTIVGAVLISLTLFNVYTMMTIYKRHSCAENDAPTGSSQRDNSIPNKDDEEIGNHLSDQKSHSKSSLDNRRIPDFFKGNPAEHNSGVRVFNQAHRRHQWTYDDQLAGLVAPPEPKLKKPIAGQLGVEGVHRLHEKLHHDDVLGHSADAAPDLSNKVTLISEMNSTIHDWPWPSAAETHTKCEQKIWPSPSEMPDVSVIITFHETETIAHLLRTVHSLVQRTPRVLLKQIVLIADNTHSDNLGDILDVYVRAVFREGLVTLVRSNVSLGLIKARLVGVTRATGDVLVFMDSHMEVQHHWLEPLLYEIMMDRGTLASSFLDWFESADGRWKYRHGDSSWITYFDWAFTFGFQDLAQSPLDNRNHSTEAVRSPVTVGGMFAIQKKFFQEIGSYDDEMTRWGGENIDLALRVWLCGGRVVNVPCSHAAHFESPTSRSYRDSWTKDIHRNYQRVAEVWLGPFRKYFYENFPHLKGKSPGNLTSRFRIKKICKRPFKWLLQNVIPQLGLPDTDSIAYGGVENHGLHGFCLDSRDLRVPGVTKCSETTIQTQNFFWSLKGHLRMPIHMLNLARHGSVVLLEEGTKFYNASSGTIWFHVKDSVIVETKTGKCLEAEVSLGLSLHQCDPGNKRQQWTFRTYNPTYFQILRHQTVASVDNSVMDKFAIYMKYTHKKRRKHKQRKDSFNEKNSPLQPEETFNSRNKG